MATPTPVITAALSATPATASPASRGRRRTLPLLGIALALSLAVHLAFSLWPVRMPDDIDAPPLQASITAMPPPPQAAARTPPARTASKVRPKRTARAPPPVVAPAPLGAPEPEAMEPEAIEPTAEAIATGPDMPAPPPELATTESGVAPASTLVETLPPRVDLVYTVFYGTQGFMIGEATYRFEHADNQYRIATVGEARGLAALLLRGQGRIESRGTITASGLQPLEFSVERGSRDRRETALFDWETGMVTLHEQKTAALDLPTYDPLSLMWQFYFSPPVEGRFGFAVATTRRVLRYEFKREGSDRMAWAQGEIETERWHRRSEDGKTEALVWLAPSLNYIPIKMRVSNTDRGTVEALLDSIRVDEKVARQ